VRVLLRLGPYALLALTGAWVALEWERMPARYPVHWGVGGPDRWVDLSPRAVGIPLVLGALLVAWLGWLRRFVLANSAPAPDPSRARRLVRAATAASQWTLALVFAAAAVPKQGPGLVVAAAGAGFLLLPVALVATYAGKAEPEPEVPSPPGGWLLVQRANGTGLTLDPRHPGFRGAIVRFLAWPVAVMLLALLA
jgi:hypothetical protein